MEDRELGIYIHIPFCESKCIYCDFPSYAGAEPMMESYLRALLTEINSNKDYINSRNIKSIYIGGGTPTYFEVEYIKKILYSCFQLSELNEDIEITIEANPNTLDEHKLQVLKACKVNRLSIGLQTWQESHLRFLGRTHDAARVQDEVRCARTLGFGNISLDLMFGLPNQSLDDWMETLKQACELDVDHVSAYSLIVEKSTPLFEMMRDGQVEPITEDIERQMHKEGIAYLEDRGYRQYEISNFAKPGFESVHNLIYWKNEYYIGFGCGAHTYIDNIRRYNFKEIDEYIDSIARRGNAIEYTEHIGVDIERFEVIMMGLRLTDGIDKQGFEDRFGKSLDYYYADVLSKLKDDGLIDEDDKSIYVTSRGMDIHNTLLLDFLDYKDK